ncbi:flagellar protein FlgN [Ramlibacter sp.]|uniref:flagella synthesis protein FlgN n=1 Tax=Ramlibacter sp. TaxID=1917967 RepID=UPI002C2EBBF6|nr:flagellar protein FlgN [Ramlibacter sp.]HWI82110.1 flagellar protein FlgN [Ramlibacter sp.]
MSPLLGHVLAESACLQSYIAALEAEDQALLQGRIDDLPAIAERKTGILSRIAALDQEREAAQAALGLPAGRAGAERAAQASEPLARAWTALLAHAHRARELNRRVAAKVYTHLDFTRNALLFLQSRGQPLYGRDGTRSAPARGSSLALG